MVFVLLSSLLKSRAALQLENIALRHQIGVLQRSCEETPPVEQFGSPVVDCALPYVAGVALCAGDCQARFVIAWHRKAFRMFWTWKVRRGKAVHPAISAEILALICQMNGENPGWGAPRIHGELLKLGIDIGETSVSKYLVRSRKPPSQTWRTFLHNHLQALVSVDFFTVPTIRFQVLYVFLVLAHERRHIVHFAVTAHPTAEWTAHQLGEAFPWESAPRAIYCVIVTASSATILSIKLRPWEKQGLSAPASPWQRAYIERLIGSIRRECLDHLIVFNERTLKQHLRAYEAYCYKARTHLALQKDCPEPRPVQPVELGPIVSIPELGGLHHRYERRVA
jgi:putative transposase